MVWEAGAGESANQGKVDAVFLDFVEGELCEHQLGKRMARMSGASDSSGSNEPMISTDQLPYKVKTKAAMLKKFGRPF